MVGMYSHKIIERRAEVFYLQHFAPFPRLASGWPDGVSFQWLKAPEIPVYLSLYQLVGTLWNWSTRLLMSADELQKVLEQPARFVGLLKWDGQEAGMVELFHHDDTTAELEYFGLAPSFIGKGLGRPLMQEVFRHARDCQIQRVFLHTCSFDSPAAMPFYQRCGFALYHSKFSIEKHLL